jgi:hypothetical protein
MSDPKQLVDSYVAQWNEPDPDVRAELIRRLWAADGLHVLVNPPQEMREAAASLAFPVPPLEVRGHEALIARVARAYDMFIASGDHVFEATGEPHVLRPNLVGLRWTALETRTRERTGGGFDVLSLDDDGRIRTDHQFVDMS